MAQTQNKFHLNVPFSVDGLELNLLVNALSCEANEWANASDVVAPDAAAAKGSNTITYTYASCVQRESFQVN